MDMDLVLSECKLGCGRYISKHKSFECINCNSSICRACSEETSLSIYCTSCNLLCCCGWKIVDKNGNKTTTCRKCFEAFESEMKLGYESINWVLIRREALVPNITKVLKFKKTLKIPIELIKKYNETIDNWPPKKRKRRRRKKMAL